MIPARKFVFRLLPFLKFQAACLVKKRSATSSPLSEPPESMDMDVDEAPMPNSPTNDSAMIPERTTPSPYQRLTPPTSVHQPVNAPSSADVTARTKQLIADIKAKAMAQVKANPTEAAKSLEFREDLSDSDSDDDLQPLEAEVKGKAKTVGEAARPPPGASTRYNTRSADAQASSSKANRVSPIALQSERRKSANKKDNPFLALLKEKRDEERSGRSTMDYIKAAEIALAKDRMLLEMDDEDGDDGLSGPSEYQQANSGKEADEIKVDLDDRDRERLFGDQGAQIKGILDDDRENREADERLQSRVGVPFWKRNAGNDDAVTSAKPALDFGNYANQPILSMLHKAFELADEKRSIAILNLGLLNTLNYENHAGVVDYLSYLALTPKCEQLGSAAFKALINIWTVSSTGRTPGISLQSILNAVSGLGATAEYLNLLPAENPNLDDERRNTLVFRMIKMIESSARRRLLNPTEVPGIVPVLLAISLDPSTSVSLQDEITLGLDAIFQSIADPNVVADIEPSICTEVLAYISNLDTVNISHVVTLLAGGTGRGTRIARWVARSVLLDRTEVAEGEYCHTPAVDDLSAILVQGKPTSCQAFQVNKDTDYVEMGYFVQILAVALTDISDYLPREIAAIAELKAGQCSQKSPSKEKPETPFQYLENCMTFLHRKITDHGTDIERSRTKAALHHLTMRLHYQLKAGTRSNKSNNIDHYFSRGNVGPRA
ncbi:hypothetical protein GYMLUDRAFT_867397 [Collybiopsis luxurians FD-317 M1]|nr:hypothetical protein GYMLUDRAFT_867397 [Collybiopsis luxurians FD-317 M1]